MLERYQVLIDFNLKASGNAASQLRDLVSAMDKVPAAVGQSATALKQFQAQLNGTLLNSTGANAGIRKLLNEMSAVGTPLGTELEKMLIARQTKIVNAFAKSGTAGAAMQTRLLAAEMDKMMGGMSKGQVALMKPHLNSIVALENQLSKTLPVMNNSRIAMGAMNTEANNLNNTFGRTAIAMMVFYQMNQMITSTVNSARELERAVSATQAILQGSKFAGQGGASNFIQMKSDVMGIAQKYGVKNTDVSESLNTVFQAADVTTRQALELTKTINTIATVGRSGIETAAEVLMAAKNAFNLDTKGIEKFTDKFLMMWKDAVITLDQAKTSLGQVFKAGSMFGFTGSDRDLTRMLSLATLVTKEGGTASRNLTQLSRALTDFADPKKQDRLKAAGIVFSGATEGDKNWGALMQTLKAGPEFIAKNVPLIQSRMALTTLAKEMSAGRLDAELKGIGESAGFATNALETMWDKPTKRLEQFNALIANFKTLIGADLVTAVDAPIAALKALGDTIDLAFSKAPANLQGAIASGKILGGGVLRGVTEVVGGLTVANMGLMMAQFLTGAGETQLVKGGGIGGVIGQRMNAVGSNIFGYRGGASQFAANQLYLTQMQTGGTGAISNKAIEKFKMQAAAQEAENLAAVEAKVAARAGLGVSESVSGAGNTLYRVESGIAGGIGRFATGAEVVAYKAASAEIVDANVAMATSQVANTALLAETQKGLGKTATAQAGLSGAMGGVTVAILAFIGASAVYNAVMQNIASQTEKVRRDQEDFTDYMNNLPEIYSTLKQIKGNVASGNVSVVVGAAGMTDVVGIAMEQNPAIAKMAGYSVSYSGPGGARVILDANGNPVNDMAGLERAQQVYDLNRINQEQLDLPGQTKQLIKNARVEAVNQNGLGWWRNIKGAFYMGESGYNVKQDFMKQGFSEQDSEQKAIAEIENRKAKFALGSKGAESLDAAILKINSEAEGMAASLKASKEAITKGLTEELTKSSDRLAAALAGVADSWQEEQKLLTKMVDKIGDTIKGVDKINSQVEIQIQWEVLTNKLTSDKVDERKRQLTYEKNATLLLQLWNELADLRNELAKAQVDGDTAQVAEIQKALNKAQMRTNKLAQIVEKEAAQSKLADDISAAMTSYAAAMDAAANAAEAQQQQIQVMIQNMSGLGANAQGLLGTKMGFASAAEELYMKMVAAKFSPNVATAVKPLIGAHFAGLQLPALFQAQTSAAEEYNLAKASVNPSNLGMQFSSYINKYKAGYQNWDDVKAQQLGGGDWSAYASSKSAGPFTGGENAEWDSIYVAAKKIRGGSVDKMCAAFTSERLRRFGIPIPKYTTTKEVYDWINSNMAPSTITKVEDLKQGDILFETPPTLAGSPAGHVGTVEMVNGVPYLYDQHGKAVPLDRFLFALRPTKGFGVPGTDTPPIGGSYPDQERATKIQDFISSWMDNEKIPAALRLGGLAPLFAGAKDPNNAYKDAQGNILGYKLTLPESFGAYGYKGSYEIPTDLLSGLTGLSGSSLTTSNAGMAELQGSKENLDKAREAIFSKMFDVIFGYAGFSAQLKDTKYTPETAKGINEYMSNVNDKVLGTIDSYFQDQVAQGKAKSEALGIPFDEQAFMSGDTGPMGKLYKLITDKAKEYGMSQMDLISGKETPQQAGDFMTSLSDLYSQIMTSGPTISTDLQNLQIALGGAVTPWDQIKTLGTDAATAASSVPASMRNLVTSINTAVAAVNAIAKSLQAKVDAAASAAAVQNLTAANQQPANAGATDNGFIGPLQLPPGNKIDPLAPPTSTPGTGDSYNEMQPGIGDPAKRFTSSTGGFFGDAQIGAFISDNGLIENQKSTSGCGGDTGVPCDTADTFAGTDNQPYVPNSQSYTVPSTIRNPYTGKIIPNRSITNPERRTYVKGQKAYVSSSTLPGAYARLGEMQIQNPAEPSQGQKPPSGSSGAKASPGADLGSILSGAITAYFQTLMGGGTGADAKLAAKRSIATGLISWGTNIISGAAGGGILGQLGGALLGGVWGLLITKLFKLNRPNLVDRVRPAYSPMNNPTEFMQSFGLPSSAYFNPTGGNTGPVNFTQNVTNNITGGPKTATRVQRSISDFALLQQYNRGFG